jgi:hypothetical protein
MNELTGGIRQLGTHRKLVSQTKQRELGARLTLDAIIVPASRPAENLEQAITLARAAHCVLLILCSREVKPAEVHRLLTRRSFGDAIVVSLPEGYRHDLLDFRALASVKDELPSACSYYITDLSTKRNVGLILARMLGWQRIFFLDDDIRDVSPSDLQSTVSMLGSFRTAGMRVTDFPDNSAACHAHRITGGMQDVFVSGAALAVDCQHDIAFFPEIYNEDWLFFYDDAAQHRLGSSPHRVTQLRYDPFADPQRAAWQEFGDVLAEGLYALLDRDMDVRYATREYWSYFLEARRRFLEAIISRSEPSTRTELREQQLLLSVETALKCSMGISPELFEHYIYLWRRDLRDWQRQTTRITRMPSLDAALQALGLEQSSDNPLAGRGHFTPRAEMEIPSQTVPFTMPDFYDLVRLGADDGERTEKPSGSATARDGGRLASIRRAFRIPRSPRAE